MAEYQSIFTRVQVTAPPYIGAPLKSGGTWVRQGKPVFNELLGYFGDTQIGPIYLGLTGLLSLLCGFIAVEIIGRVTTQKRCQVFAPSIIAASTRPPRGAVPSDRSQGRPRAWPSPPTPG